MIAAVNSKGGRKILAIRAKEGGFFFFAMGTMVGMIFYDVIFTIITKWRADKMAPLARMRCEKVEETGECCIFYYKWHILLDFTTIMV